MSVTGPFIDISVPLSDRLPTWPDDPNTSFEPTQRIAYGFDANVSRLGISTHAGTHVDAPFHFLPDGITIEALPLDLFIGPARVCAVNCGTHITAADVAQAGIRGETRVLFKTRNSTLLKVGVYDASFAPFSVDGAKALVDLGVKLVGLDYLSAAAANEQVPVHRAFLDHGVILLEGVDLSEVPAGRYELFCPPVKLAGSDGAPCRAVLRDLA